MERIEPIDQDQVGKFLKELRTKKKVSQRQLAEELFMTRQSVSLWENGKTLPDYDSAVLLANYFDISIGELFAGKYITDKDELNRATANVIRIELRKSHKRLLELFATIIICTFIFLSYFFFSTYNSIHVYLSNYEEHGFEINSLLTKSVNDVYLNININKSANKLCLYYKDNNELLCKNESNNIIFSERLGYNELIQTTDFDDFINNLYLSADDKLYKLDFYESYRNDELVFKKDNDVIDKENLNNDNNIPKYVKDNFNYDSEKNEYNLSLKNNKVSLTFVVESQNFIVVEKDDKYSSSYLYDYKEKKLVLYNITDNDSNKIIKQHIFDNENDERYNDKYNYFMTTYANKYL